MSIEVHYTLIEGLDFTGKSTISKLLSQKSINDGPIPGEYNNMFMDPTLHSGVQSVSTGELSPAYKEMYFKGLYALDRTSKNLPLNLVIQDRYFPSILFYGNIINGTQIPSQQEMQENFLMPKGILLFEKSYDEVLTIAQSRGKLSRLEKVALESRNQYEIMKQRYRELIFTLGCECVVVDTTNESIDDTLEECYGALFDSDLLLEEVRVADLQVSWEAKVYPSTAQRYVQDIEAEKRIRPLIVHRIINQEDGSIVDLVEDGRHRAYAHHLIKLVSAKAFIRRLPMTADEFNQLSLTKLADFTFK